MEYVWNKIPEIPGRKIELVLASDNQEHLIISDYFSLQDSNEWQSKRYLFIAKYRQEFEGVESIHEIQFNQLFLSLAECKEFAERFLESRQIANEP